MPESQGLRARIKAKKRYELHGCSYGVKPYIIYLARVAKIREF
jgi:hypothetical protein